VVITHYMSRTDGPDPLSGLDLVEADIEFLPVLQDREVIGRGHGDLGAYVARRLAVGRTHQVLRESVDGDMEMSTGLLAWRDASSLRGVPAPAGWLLASKAQVRSARSNTTVITESARTWSSDRLAGPSMHLPSAEAGLKTVRPSAGVGSCPDPPH
jgi:hypothetical protein